MKNTFKTTAYFIFLFFLSLLCCGASESSPVELLQNKNVLLLGSYNSSTAWTNRVVEEIDTALRACDAKLEIIAMNTSSANLNKLSEVEFERIVNKIKTANYDLIIGLDPSAMRFFESCDKDFEKNTPILSLGCANFNQTFLKDNPNISYIRQDFKIKENFELAMKLFPHTKEIVVLLDGTQEGDRLKEECKNISKELPCFKKTTVVYLESGRMPTSEMLKYLAKASPDTVIIYLGWDSPAAYGLADIFDKIRRACPFPIISPISTDDHILCGYMPEASEHGKLAAQTALEVLDGIPIEKLESIDGPTSSILNWQESQRRRVSISDMPKGFVYAGKPNENTNFYIHMAAVFIVAAILIAMVAYSIHRKRDLRNKLKEIYKNLPIDLAIVNKKGEMSFVHSEIVKSEVNNLKELENGIGILYKDAIDSLLGSKKESTEFEFFWEERRKLGMVKKIPPQIFGADNFMCTAIDITESYNTKEALKCYAEQERVLNKYLKLTNRNIDPNKVIRELLKSVKDNLKSDRIFVYMLNNDRTLLTRVSSWDIESEKLPNIDSISVSPEKSFLEKLENREIIFCKSKKYADFTDADALAESVENAGISSVAFTGFQIQGKLAGIVGVSFLNEKRTFSDIEKQMLKASVSVIEILKRRLDYTLTIEKVESEKSTIMNSIDIPAVIFDLDMNILAENPAAEGIAQSIPNRMLKTDCPCILKLEVCMQDACLFRNCLRFKKEFSGEVKIKGVPYKAAAKPIFDKFGNMYRILCTLVDVTDFTIYKNKLEDVVRAEKNANMAKSAFIATMSHEIRTPLNAIIGYSELTQDLNISEEERIENLKNIRFSADSLLILINDILDLSKLEAGQIEVFKTATNIETLIHNLARIFALRIERKKLSLEYDIQNDIPLLMLDAKRLKQIIINLLGNAVKFTSAGSIKISARYGENRLSIAIADTGMGIEKSYQERIFIPFVQQPDTLMQERRESGTGLGLSISRKLAEVMHGEISLESELGKGSTFTLSIGDIDEASPENDPYSFIQEIGTLRRSDITKHTAIIIDDVPMNLKILASILKRLGVSYHSCTSAREALDLLEFCTPTIILTDLWMPEMNGDAFAEKIRQIPALSEIPIVAITADVQAQSHSEIFNSILLKPITVAKVRELLEKFPTDIKNENIV